MMGSRRIIIAVLLGMIAYAAMSAIYVVGEVEQVIITNSASPSANRLRPPA